jgi:hypothetical protein
MEKHLSTMFVKKKKKKARRKAGKKRKCEKRERVFCTPTF